MARGHNHTTLVDRAQFYPLNSYPDENDMFDFPQEEEEEEEEDDDEIDQTQEELDDLPSRSGSDIDLEVLMEIVNQESTSLKRKDHPEGLFQESLDAETEPKRSRIEEPDTITPSQLFNKIALAIGNLSPSHTPSTLLGRDEEYREINRTIDEMVSASSGSLRISGLHGQGKTMTTKLALSNFSSSDVHVVWLSATEQNSLRDIIKLIISSVSSSNASGDPHDILRQILKATRTPILVVVDEIDILPAKIREGLVSMANKPHSNLLLVGLANNIFSESFQSSITFEPYDEATLTLILNHLTYHLFEEKSVSLIAKTYASKGKLVPRLASVFLTPDR